MQAHFSGGEPTARKDLEELIKHAAKEGLYTNLITSGVLVNEDRLKKLYDSGLDHVQISIQDTDPENSEKIAGFKGHNKKIEVCGLVRKVGLPLTINSGSTAAGFLSDAGAGTQSWGTHSNLFGISPPSNLQSPLKQGAGGRIENPRIATGSSVPLMSLKLPEHLDTKNF